MEHGAELAAFLGAVTRLDQAALLALSVEPSADEADALGRARAEARKAAARGGLEQELDRLRGEIVTWSSAGGAHAAIWAPDLPKGDVLLEDLRQAASQAIFDAATTYLLGPALDGHSRDVLLSRWQLAAG